MNVQTNQTMLLAKSAKSFKRPGTDEEFKWWELTFEDGDELLTLKADQAVFDSVEKYQKYNFVIRIRNGSKLDVRIVGLAGK